MQSLKQAGALSQIQLSSLGSSPIASLDLAAAAGGFVLVYSEVESGLFSETWRVKAQPLSADGTRFGLSRTVSESDNEYGEPNPVVAGLANGDFVVTWTHEQSQFPSSDYDVVARRFTATGTDRAPMSPVSTTTYGYQAGSQVTALSGGGFAVLWEHEASFSTFGMDVRMQIYGANGQKVGTDIIVDSGRFGEQTGGRLVQLSSGTIAAVWNDGDGLALQMFSATGKRIGTEIVIERGIEAIASEHRVTAVGNDLVVTWKREIWSPFGFDVSYRAQRFDCAGRRIGSEQVIATGDETDVTDVVALSDGSYAALYKDYRETVSGGEFRTSVQVFNQAGTMAADRIEVAVGSEPSLTAITAAGSNSLIVAWESDPGVISTQKLQIRTSDDITTRVPQAATSGTGGSDSLIGTALNNDLSGLAGHDILDGGLGNDRLMGGAGSDLLVGGAGQDEAVYWQATAGVVADLTDFALNTGEAAGDRYVSIERLGGSNYRDSLRGDAAANVLSGHSGNDDLVGRGGADRLDGGAGNDTLVGGDGADHLIGGSGTDTASYAGASKAVTANLGKSSLNTNEAKGDVYAGVENLIGSSHSDALTGDAGSNWLYGGSGNDKLSGGSGNDRLVGGAGRDSLAGGSGRDAFVFDTKLASSNIDRITDFSVKEDALWLDDDVFKNIGKVAGLAPAAFHIGTKAHDRTDRVIYNKTTGGLYFDPDGTGSAKAILFAELGAGLALSAKNIAVTA